MELLDSFRPNQGLLAGIPGGQGFRRLITLESPAKKEDYPQLS